jgi:hypothetical protein
VRAWALAVGVAICAAGCGGSSEADRASSIDRRSVEETLRAGDAPGISLAPADDVTCDPPDVVGAVRCRVAREDRTTYVVCVEGQTMTCATTGAPPGVAAFTTPELRAAPKDVYWKCEDVDASGRDVGPVWTTLRDDPDREEQSAEWMTEAEARAYARDLGATFSADC